MAHVYDPSTAMVAVDVMYDVGSRDERPDLTGMAHLFEHLMFGGSAHVADFDARLSAAGGISNAWTSNDFTNFYIMLPAVNLSTALWLESDRMLALDCSERALRVQQSVVTEEFKQVCLNQPYGDLDHRLRELAFTVHPYRTPVIGKDFSHIERVTTRDVEQWFQSHYSPDNAVITICGNVSFDDAVEQVERYFGDIPRRPKAPRTYAPEPEQTEARSLVVSGPVPQTALRLVFPMEAYGTRGYFEADTLSDILANGRSSRLYRELVLGSGLFTSVDASILGTEEPGFFMVSAKLTGHGDDAERKAVEAITAQLQRLATEAPAERELQRCVNLLESNHTFNNLNCLAQAQTVALAEMHRENPDDFMLPYRAHTPERLRLAAASLFRPDRASLLIYRPLP